MPPRLLRLDDSILRLDKFDHKDQDLKDKIHARLQERSEPDHESGCVIYTGFWEDNGQGKIRVGMRVTTLPRVVAWLYVTGFRIYGPERAVRTCLMPACCNPDHVRVVNDQGDAMRAQRAAGKLGDSRHKLTRKIASEIRVMAAEGVPLPTIAGIYKVQLPAVRAVILGRTWAPKEAA